MRPAIIRLLLALAFMPVIAATVNAQSTASDNKEAKPYSIFTSGKKITIKSRQDIKSIMVWTASGNRIVEQKDINAPFFSFTVAVNEKIFFVMLEMKGEKRYTEKIGVL